MRKPSKSELAEMLEVTEETFHKEIKPLIKKDFASELKQCGMTNPDIWLDQNNNVVLVMPIDEDIKVETNLSIYNYK